MGGSQSTPSTPQHDKAALDINANAVPVDLSYAQSKCQSVAATGLF